MSRHVIPTEIAVPADRVWHLLTDPKEFAFWAPNVRDLEMEPADQFSVNSIRHFRLEVAGKIETLDTRITHLTFGESFAETPVGGSLRIHERVDHLKMIYRVEKVDEKTTSLTFTLDYEMKGLMNKLLESVYMGGFTSQLKLWFERLKTYAETGRPV